MKYLFVCAIGPVQDFIATARRSRDLWYGSWMLSELSKAAAKKVDVLFPKSLVFPDPALLETGSRLNVPNKISAIFEEDPGQRGEEVREAVAFRMEELGKDALKPVKGRIDYTLAQQQIKDLLEFYWVSVPFQSDKDYPEARDRAEALLAARKATRDFKQAEGRNVPKSSLDGARESVIPKSEYPERNEPIAAKEKKIQNLYRHYHARQGEQLSGVDLLKRLGERKNEPDFKSTSDMAAIPFLERVEREKGKGKDRELLGKIRTLLEQSDWDIDEAEEELVFDSRLSDWVPAGKQQDDLRKGIADLLKEYTNEKFSPNPYYALIAADGDNMGVVIDAQQDPKAHRDLSGALSQFAADVPGIVEDEKTNGVLIYAGGDDVLAYLPLNTVLNCAAQLEKVFREKLARFTALKEGEIISPTLSIGIIIAHHLEPLSDVLELARSAEREAKQEKGKNGLAITLRKRGGADRTISGKWGMFDERLKELIKLYSTKAISGGTAYELQKLHRDLSGTGIPADGLAKEALRIVKRKRESGGEEDIKKEVKDAFKQWLVTDGIPLDELAKEMIIAGMFKGDAEPLAATDI